MKTVLLKCPDCGESFVCEDTRRNLSLTADTAVESAATATVIAMTMINNKRKELLPCGISLFSL